MMAKIIQERLKWFRAFIPLYERAEPLVKHITNLNKLRTGELPVSPALLVESNLTLRPILSAVSKLQKPKEKELASMQREFALALSHCIKASEWAEKYLNYSGYGMDRQMMLSMVINATVVAHEYIESVSKKLAPYLGQEEPI
jgi:hypothetical protein